MQVVHRLHANVHGPQDRRQADQQATFADGQFRVPVLVGGGGLQFAVWQRHQHIVHGQQSHGQTEQVSELRGFSPVVRHGKRSVSGSAVDVVRKNLGIRKNRPPLWRGGVDRLGEGT